MRRGGREREEREGGRERRDTVGVHDGVETMSDGEDGCVFEVFPHCVLDQLICPRIHTTFNRLI